MAGPSCESKLTIREGNEQVTRKIKPMTDQELDQLSINTIRTLSIDAVQQAKSGHPGTPMALAPLVYTIWNRVMRFDPEDLTRIDVYLDGRPAGVATPFVTRRHVHPAVPQAARPEPDPTGIDYLGLVTAAHDEQAGTGTKIDFSQIHLFADPDSHHDEEQAR